MQVNSLGQVKETLLQKGTIAMNGGQMSYKCKASFKYCVLFA